MNFEVVGPEAYSARNIKKTKKNINILIFSVSAGFLQSFLVVGRKEKHLIIQYELAIIIPQVDTIDTVDTFGKIRDFE
jgi:methionine aminopeptidase